MKIEGVAYMPEPDEFPDTWHVPTDPIPLRVEFNPMRDPIGTAVLTKHPDGTITATAEIVDGEGPYLSSFPKFAVGIALQPGSELMRDAQVYGVSVCHENKNPDVPQYKVVDE